MLAAGPAQPGERRLERTEPARRFAAARREEDDHLGARFGAELLRERRGGGHRRGLRAGKDSTQGLVTEKTLSIAWSQANFVTDADHPHDHLPVLGRVGGLATERPDRTPGPGLERPQTSRPDRRPPGEDHRAETAR